MADQQVSQSSSTQKLEAQGWKINMLRRMMGIHTGHNEEKIIRLHRLALEKVVSTDVYCTTNNSWRVMCSDVPEGSVLVTHIVGTDIQCDCIDYPADYVCSECSICIHMYSCSCGEVDKFPSLICKHIHATILYGTGVVKKQDIGKHTKTPHCTPGHKWPNPIIYRLHISGGKQGAPKTLVPVSSTSIVVKDKDCSASLERSVDNGPLSAFIDKNIYKKRKIQKYSTDKNVDDPDYL